MNKIMLWLFYAIVLGLGAWVLIDNPGTVSITWFDYVVETSVAFCIALLLALILAVHLILFPFRWLRWIRVSMERKRFTRFKEILIEILSNVLCNNLSVNNDLIN